jgi:hypothetical protein
MARICSAISRTTMEQKWGGGTWLISAAVAELTPSTTPVETASPTINACDAKIIASSFLGQMK